MDETPAPATPEINAPVSTVIAKLASLAINAGEPTGIDLSVVLHEITISFPTASTFQGWSDALGATQSVQDDALGNLAIAHAGTQGTWKIRLHYHGDQR